MTRKEAIKILKSMSDISTQGEAIDMAIEALKEQPTIPMFTESEEAYKAWTGEEMGRPHGRLIDADFEEQHYASMLLNPSPDVTAKDKEDARIILGALKMAKTVSTDRPHGEWKIDEYGIYHCPYCHAINNTVYKSFCPNCGTKMGGDGE